MTVELMPSVASTATSCLDAYISRIQEFAPGHGHNRAARSAHNEVPNLGTGCLSSYNAIFWHKLNCENFPVGEVLRNLSRFLGQLILEGLLASM
jgi:hypothetical protein